MLTKIACFQEKASDFSIFEHSIFPDFFEYGSGCYRKHFRLAQSDAGKRVTVYFEGVASSCSVYLNGCLLGENFSAYHPFELELNDYARWDGDNTLAVLVDGTAQEGWWYAGAGIVRNVWLRKTELVSIDRDGIYAMPQPGENDEWRIPGELTLRNDDAADHTVIVHTALSDGTACETTVTLPAEQVTTVCLPMQVHAPQRWDIDAQNLYTYTVTLREHGALLDADAVRIGFRTAEFTRDGFWLNGRRVQLHGVCCHEDYAITGRVMPYAVQELRLQKLREFGVNAYRCAHYEQSADTMDLLDELGFLVMAENRHFESIPRYLDYFADQLRRDRNHPSIILWSTSNEEPLHAQPQGARIQHKLAQLVRRFDPRPITCAVSNDPVNATVYGDCDVIGVNYNVAQLDAIREKYPDRPILMSECVACGTTRSWYTNPDPVANYLSAYDQQTYDFGQSVEQMAQLLADRPYFAGGFVWAGAEHRGEATWPRLFSQAGLLDAGLHKKDSAWCLQACIDRAHPMIHLLPHWNHIPGEPVRVWAYTNCEEAELFLNGKSLGRQPVAAIGHAEWTVPFEPGALHAVGYRDGRAAAEDTVRTAGKPVRLALTLENRTPLSARRTTAVVTCCALDEAGVPVPDASVLVRFAVRGEAQLRGTVGSVCDHTPAPSRERRMFMGRCSAAAEVTGACTVYAAADGLAPAALSIRPQA